MVYLHPLEKETQRSRSHVGGMQTPARPLIDMGPEGTSDVWPRRLQSLLPSTAGVAPEERTSVALPDLPPPAHRPHRGRPPPRARPTHQLPALHAGAVPRASLWGTWPQRQPREGAGGGSGLEGLGRRAGPNASAGFAALVGADRPRLCPRSRGGCSAGASLTALHTVPGLQSSVQRLSAEIGELKQHLEHYDKIQELTRMLQESHRCAGPGGPGGPGNRGRWGPHFRSLMKSASLPAAASVR